MRSLACQALAKSPRRAHRSHSAASSRSSRSRGWVTTGDGPAPEAGPRGCLLLLGLGRFDLRDDELVVLHLAREGDLLPGVSLERGEILVGDRVHFVGGHEHIGPAALDALLDTGGVVSGLV